MVAVKDNIFTVEARYNGGPRDWHNLFAITSFSYIEVVFHFILLLLGQRKLFVIPRTLFCRSSL